MVIHSAKKGAQWGMTLIELLIASLVGAIVIGTVGSVFVSGQKLATERGLQLLLAQNLSSTILQIKEDIQRAGFNGLDATSVKLSGAEATVFIDSESSLVAYVYRVSSEGALPFRNVVFKREDSNVEGQGNSLKICEKHSATPLSVSSASSSGSAGFCYNLFNPAQLSISDFSPIHQSVRGGDTSTQMVTISLQGHLVADNTISYRTEVSTLLRNSQ